MKIIKQLFKVFELMLFFNVILIKLMNIQLFSLNSPIYILIAFKMASGLSHIQVLFQTKVLISGMFVVFIFNIYKINFPS